MQAGVGLAQQIQSVIQELAAGDSVEVLQLLNWYFWLYHHDTQNKGRVLDLKDMGKSSNKQKSGGVTELIFHLAFILFPLTAHPVQFWTVAPRFAMLSRITIPALSQNRQPFSKAANAETRT